MRMLLICIGLQFFSIGGLTTLNNPESASLEQLIGVSVDEYGITFQVSSNGCTQKTDFDFQVEEILEPISPWLPAFDHHHYITVKRSRTDTCEMYVPYGITIFVSFEDLGISSGPFHVRNPI